MKISERNNIIRYAAGLSDEDLRKEYYDVVFDSLGSQTEKMYDLGYDMKDIEEQIKYEKHLSEKGNIIGMLCEERGIGLWKEN